MGGMGLNSSKVSPPLFENIVPPRSQVCLHGAATFLEALFVELGNRSNEKDKKSCLMISISSEHTIKFPILSQ